MKYRLLNLLWIWMFPLMVCAQINTDRVMAIGRNALYFEDYVLSIQYFNQVINAKPYLSDPYFFRGLAKINLDDFPVPVREHIFGIDKPVRDRMKGLIHNIKDFIRGFYCVWNICRGS